MFPHPFDRYNILGFIIQRSRESLGLKQKQLADVAYIAQTTVSHLESLKHIERIIKLGHKPISRRNLVTLAARGLHMTVGDVNALLWLLEGEDHKSLSAGEVTRYVDTPAATDALSDDPATLRAHVLHMLRNALGPSPDSLKQAAVNILTEWGEKGQLLLRSELFKIEKKPGQRLLVSKYPSYLARKEQVQVVCNSAYSEEHSKDFQGINNRRRRRYHRNLRTYGERCIHSIESLQRYLREDFTHELNYEQRRAHFASWIDLLKRYSNYEVGLAKTEPEMEFVIKSPFAACLRGTSRNIPVDKEAVICGPLYVYWDDTSTVYSFYLDFEREWDKIQPRWRDRKNVIEWLESLLRS